MKSKKKILKLNKMEIAKIGNISNIKGGTAPDTYDTDISIFSCGCDSIPNANDEAPTSV